MNALMIGNACSICATITDSVGVTRKRHSTILAVQTLSQVFYAAGAMILGGYSGAVQNLVAVLRNLAAIKRIGGKAVEWTLILLGVALGAAFNNLGLIGMLPVIGNLIYSVAVFRSRGKETLLRAAFLVCTLTFAVFNVAIKNYAGAAADTAVTVTTVVSVIRGVRARRGAAAESA